jgi:hypothetical protein
MISDIIHICVFRAFRNVPARRVFRQKAALELLKAYKLLSLMDEFPAETFPIKTANPGANNGISRIPV